MLALQVVVCYNVELLFFSGVGVLFGTVSPSRPDPCLVFCLRPTLLFCSVGFVDAVFSRLCSFFQALGKPKPFWFGFPLVFSSSCTRTTTTTRTSSSSNTPRLRPAPVFAFVLRPTSFVFLVVVGLGFLWSLWASLSLSRWFGCAVSMSAVIRQRKGVAYQTAPPL